MLEDRVEATVPAVVDGVGVRLLSGDVAVDMMAAQSYF